LANKEVKFTYDATGLNRKVERYVDGLLKLTTTGRLTGISQANGTGVISNDLYDLDILGRLKTETVDGQSRSISYDNTDQVKTVTGSNSEGYTYDQNGNRTGGGYVTDTGNRLMSDGVYNYEYDPEGNRTKRTKISDNTVDEYGWDYRNRLTEIVTKNAGGSVLKTVGYEYDVDDQRVKKTVTSATPSAGDGVENYYIDRNQIAFVTDGGGNQMFHYLYGLNVDSVMAQDSPAGMVWALADRLGSIDALTDAEGNVVNKRTFDSFGRVLSESNPSVSFRYGYTGRELDLESGLNYYRARYYDSNVGRFISVDPMGFGAGDTNLYRYVSNNSTNYTDPSGEIAFLAPLVPWAIGAAVTGVTWALGGAAFGGVKESALSVAQNIDRGESIDWGRALSKGGEGAISGAVTGFGLGVVSTIPGGSIFVAGFMTKGLWDGTRNFGYHGREGEWAQAAVEAVDVGFGINNTRGPMNKAMGELSRAGKALYKALPEGGWGRSPQWAFEGVGGRQPGMSTEPKGWDHFLAMSSG
jgi:RHS repeat-associated protein